jgi:ATP-dependent Clp protease protease subunit
MIRTIVEERSKNIAVMDVFSKLAQNRIIYIDGVIDDELANGVISQLLYLDSLNSDEISIYINSGGGYIYDGLGIIDAMNLIKSPIKTVCIGKAMSMAAIILTCGKTRYATKNATIMLHQPLGGAEGTFTEIETSYKELERLKNILYDIIKNKTSISDPEESFDRDIYYTSEQAKELNIIDEILSTDKK